MAIEERDRPSSAAGAHAVHETPVCCSCATCATCATWSAQQASGGWRLAPILCAKPRCVFRAKHAKHVAHGRPESGGRRSGGPISAKRAARAPPTGSAGGRPIAGRSRLLQRIGPYSSPAPMLCTKPWCVFRAKHAKHAAHGRPEDEGRGSGGPFSAKGTTPGPAEAGTDRPMSSLSGARDQGWIPLIAVRPAAGRAAVGARTAPAGRGWAESPHPGRVEVPTASGIWPESTTRRNPPARQKLATRCREVPTTGRGATRRVSRDARQSLPGSSRCSLMPPRAPVSPDPTCGPQNAHRSGSRS
jgi:hypothetical protein